MSSKSNYIKNFLIILKTLPGDVPTCVGVFKASQFSEVVLESTKKVEEEVRKDSRAIIQVIPVDLPVDLLI